MSSESPQRPGRKKIRPKEDRPTGPPKKRRPPPGAEPAARPKSARPHQQPPPPPKKKKKKRRSSSGDNTGLWLALGGGVLFLLVAGGVGAAMMLPRGGDGDTPAVASTQLPQRVPWGPESEKPEDWKSSFKAFAANFKVDKQKDQITVTGGTVVLPSEEEQVSWEAWFQGVDTRGIAGFAPVEGMTPVKFELPDLPKPLMVIFLVSNEKLQQLKALTFQRLRFKGRFWPAPKSLWIREDLWELLHTQEQLRLTAEQPVATLAKHDEGYVNGVPNFCMIFCEVTSFAPVSSQ